MQSLSMFDRVKCEIQNVRNTLLTVDYESDKDHATEKGDITTQSDDQALAESLDNNDQTITGDIVSTF